MGELELSIGERQLDNGLVLMAVHNAGAHTFAAGVVLDVDRRDEGPDDQGVCSMIGDCLEEGTRHRDGVALAIAVDDIGGSLSGNASGGSIQCPEKNAARSLGLLRESVFEPSFPGPEVERVRDEVLQEIRVEETDPQQVASLRFRKEVYGDHPYARPSHGGAESVRRHTTTRLAGFHREWFVPAAGYVCAAGPAEVGALLDQLEREFKDLDGGRPAHRRPAPPAMPAPGIDVHLPMEREQVHVYVGHPGIRRTNPDFYALAVMDHILGTGPGFTSRIARRLRDEMGLCYSVHASITSNAGEEPGTFSAYIGTSAEHRPKAIDGFLEEIERIRQDLVTEQELSDVVEYLTGSYVFAFERNMQLASYAIRAKRFDLGFDHIRKYPQLIRSVTREDVLGVAQQYLLPEHMVRVSAGATSGSSS